MAKDYLAMIADIEESGSTGYEIDGKRGKRALSVESITPVSILAASRYGSLTRGGLRDALWLWTGLSRASADQVVSVYLESGLLVEDKDGLLMVRH